MKEKPLILRLYQESALYETARVVGYDGLPMNEREQRLQPLVERFGLGRVENALFLLTDFMPQGSKQLIELRPEVRKMCWQLLGPPPGHPEWNAYHSPEPFVPPWNRMPGKPKEEPAPKPKRSRKKAT